MALLFHFKAIFHKNCNFRTALRTNVYTMLIILWMKVILTENVVSL